MPNHISEAQLRELVGQGLSFVQIAEKVGIDVHRLRNAACLLGVKSGHPTGKRSSGSAAKYVSHVSRGETLAEIGKRYGISASAIRKALQSAGLPTCALDYLKQKHAAASALETEKT